VLDYRLYVLDGSAELHLPHEIRAPDDAAAIAIAEQHCVDGRRMELRERNRMVHCWGFAGCPSHCDAGAPASVGSMPPGSVGGGRLGLSPAAGR
jgi:hypothetical protein